MRVTNMHHNLGFRAAWFGRGAHDLGITTTVAKEENLHVYCNRPQFNRHFDEVRIVGRTYSTSDSTPCFHTIAVATNSPQNICNSPETVESFVSQGELVPLQA